jgi:hypothetical protein
MSLESESRMPSCAAHIAHCLYPLNNDKETAIVRPRARASASLAKHMQDSGNITYCYSRCRASEEWFDSSDHRVQCPQRPQCVLPGSHLPPPLPAQPDDPSISIPILAAHMLRGSQSAPNPARRRKDLSTSVTGPLQTLWPLTRIPKTWGHSRTSCGSSLPTPARPDLPYYLGAQ